MARGKMAVFGVPSAAGGRGPGVSEAPRALRDAGLLSLLAREDLRVVNLSDLSLFPFQVDDENPRARNTPVVSCAVDATADEMGRSLKEGFTLVLGGDCTLTAGVVKGARAALGRKVGLVYLDANADLNTPLTTPSGFLNGMALSLAMGEAVQGLGGAVGGQDVALIGFRELDPGEKPRLQDLALALSAEETRRLGGRAAGARARAALPPEIPLVVHLDVDVIDPEEMPARQVLTPGRGLAFSEVEELLEELLPGAVALLVAEFDPGRDLEGRVAGRLAETLARAVGRRFAS
jgi:arginase